MEGQVRGTLADRMRTAAGVSLLQKRERDKGGDFPVQPLICSSHRAVRKVGADRQSPLMHSSPVNRRDPSHVLICFC